MYNLRNRSFLKESDFTARELEHLLKLSAALKTVKVRRHRSSPIDRQGDRADLRESLHAYPLRVRG
jgi:ornithine carbamoyltransferase